MFSRSLSRFPKPKLKPNEKKRTNERIHHVLSIYHTFVHSFICACSPPLFYYCYYYYYYCCSQFLLGFLFSRSLHPFFPKLNKQTNKHHHVLLLLFIFFFPLPTNQPTNRPPCSAIIAKETGKAARLLPSPFKTAK